MEEIDPIEFPLDGTLDLHTFQPREIKTLVLHYEAASFRLAEEDTGGRGGTIPV